MPKTCPCPKCERQVAVPVDVSPHAHVRCPRCGEEYRLSDVLDFVPPLLVLVDAELSPPAERAEGDSGVGSATSVLNVEPAPLAVAAAGLLAVGQAPTAENGRQGDFFQDFLGKTEQPPQMTELPADKSAPAAAEISFEPLDVDDLPPTAAETAGSAEEGIDFTDTDDELDELEANEPTEREFPAPTAEGYEELSVGNDEADSADDEEIELDLESIAPPTAAAQTAAAATSAARSAPILPPGRKRNPHKSSFIGSLIGFTLSGALGLCAAYLGLIWFDPSADALHLAAKLPAWMVPAELRNKGQDSNVAIVDASGTPQFPKQTDMEKRLNAPDSPFNEKAPDGKSGTDGLPALPAITPPAAKPEAPAGATGGKPSEADPFAAPNAAATKENELEPAPTDGTQTPEASKPVTSTPTALTVPNPAPTAPVPAAAAQGPRGAPQFGSAELGKALEDYRVAGAAAAAASGPAARKAKQVEYKSLYNLAGTLTYLRAGEADQAAARLRDESQQAVSALAADPKRRDEMGRVAAMWLGLPAARRGAHQGVVLVGTVEQVAQRGPLEEIRLHVAAGVQQQLVVLSGTHVDLRPQQPVAVLGSIVPEPSKNVPGFSGAEQLVVWSGAVLPLEK